MRFTLAGSAQAVGDKGVRRMTFIMERCVTSGPLKVKNVRIHAATAGDCAPRHGTFDSTSCLAAGLDKPLAECSCESYSRAMNLEPFGTCKRGSITRCQAVPAAASTPSLPKKSPCACSGSDAVEVYHDKYLSNDCSGSLNAQSRVTIDAKGVRQRGFYNHSFPVDWTDIRGDALVSSQLPLPRGHCRVGFFLRGLFWLHMTFSLIGNFVRVDFAGQFPIPWRPTLPGGLQRSSVHH